MFATALLDFEDFYTNSQRRFRADLRNKHIVVLSNNDGCVVSLDKSLKELGIKRGIPLFKVENFLKYYDAEVFSSNYALYGKISDRAMDLLRKFTPDVEEYSIDEAFMLIDPGKGNLDNYLRHIQDQMVQWTGLKCRLGAGVNKVHAKLAQRLSKSEKAKGVVNLFNSRHLETALKRTEVEDIWRIGKASAKRLNEIGIFNAHQFREADHYNIRKLLTVNGARVLMELKGKISFPFENVAQTSKHIGCNRSFGAVVTDFFELKNALMFFLRQACQKLRQKGLAAKSVIVQIGNDRFRPMPERYSASMIYKSAFHSNYQEELQEWVMKVFQRIYREGIEYKRAGITLGGLIPADEMTKRLFENEIFEKMHKINLAVDKINHKYGKGTIHLGNFVSEGSWQQKQQYLSPNYLSFDQMPVAY